MRNIGQTYQFNFSCFVLHKLGLLVYYLENVLQQISVKLIAPTIKFFFDKISCNDQK